MLTSPCTACAFALCRPNHDEAERKNNAAVVPIIVESRKSGFQR